MNIKKDFPILEKYPELTYLDSACTSLKPRQVIEEECRYYEEFGACAGRSSHRLGRKTNEELFKAREGIAGFVGAREEELIITKNTTEGVNIIIHGFDFSKRKKVVTTSLEHHAVLLPLLRMRDKGIIDLEVLHPDQGTVTIEAWKNTIDAKTALVVTHHASNVTGNFQDIGEIARIAHDSGAKICVDGAQGVPHREIHVHNMNIDYLCFSSHKMLGPTGVGALICSEKEMKGLVPIIVGGGTVKTVTTSKVDYLSNHEKHEAGVQNYAGIFGFARAAQYLRKLGFDNIASHEKKIRSLLHEAVADHKTYGVTTREGEAIVSFNVGDAKPHDVALLLDTHGVAVRSGFFCAQPALEALNAPLGAVRASGYVYTTEEDVRKFKEALARISAIA